MTLHTVFFKENEGGAQNPINGGAARWSGLGCPAAAAVYGEGFIPSRLACLELSAAAKDLHGKPNTTHFNIFSGDCKSGENGKTPLLPSASSTVDYRGHLELGFGQSLICGKYPYPDQCYGLYPSYGAQFAGRMMLPLSLSSDGGPIFVNAKQYNGIMRRRKKRAEAELHNTLLKIRKPYLHLSRHLHAKRRPRGNGGRFLNTKSSTTEESSAKKTRSGSSSPSGSEMSSDHEVFPSRRGNGDGDGNANANANAAALHLFQLNHLHHSFHHHDVAGIGGIAMTPGNYLKV